MQYVAMGHKQKWSHSGCDALVPCTPNSAGLALNANRSGHCAFSNHDGPRHTAIVRARPRRDLLRRAHPERDWWMSARRYFRLVIAPFLLAVEDFEVPLQTRRPRFARPPNSLLTYTCRPLQEIPF
jgi:hypothetical protein